MSGSREAILERVRVAAAADADSRAYPDLPRQYRQHGNLSEQERVALMIERLREYDAEVTECAPKQLTYTIAALIEKSGKRHMVAPPGVPRDWLAPGCEWRIDHGLTHGEIEHSQGVITAATRAIAESGTIVLHHGETEGRRVVTLLPDWHLCVLRASQVVESLPEYFASCGTAPVLATFISGPSDTADIEMTRIKGVHGPRFLSVVLVRDDLEPGEDRS